MKLLLSACTFAILALSTARADGLTPELKATLDRWKAQCAADTGVHEGYFEEALKLNFNEDPKFKCFLKCMMVHTEVLSPEGTFDYKLVSERVMIDHFKEMGGADTMEKCKDVQGADACDMAYQLILCFAKHHEELAKDVSRFWFT